MEKNYRRQITAKQIFKDMARQKNWLSIIILPLSLANKTGV